MSKEVIKFADLAKLSASADKQKAELKRGIAASVTRVGYSKRAGLLVKLSDAYNAIEEGQHCIDSTEDLLREELPGLPDEAYAALSKELGPEAFENERISKEQAMVELIRCEQSHLFLEVINSIIDHPKPRLMGQCFLLAIGYKLPGITSERDLAKSQVVTPTYVCDIVHEWQKRFKLPKTDFQKSPEAVQAAKDYNQVRKSA